MVEISVGCSGLIEKFICLCFPRLDHGGSMRIETVTVGDKRLARDYVVEAAKSVLQRSRSLQRMSNHARGSLEPGSIMRKLSIVWFQPSQ